MQLKIGTIVNTHGIKGEVKVYPSTDSIEQRFAKGETVYCQFGKQLLSFTIATCRIHKGMVLVTFEGYPNINDVEKYKGCDLLIEVEGSEDDEDFYYFELEGCEVYLEDTLVGQVVEVLETQAHEILRIQRDGKNDLLLPYVDRFILDVNVEAKRIEIEVIEGMLE